MHWLWTRVVHPLYYVTMHVCDHEFARSRRSPLFTRRRWWWFRHLSLRHPDQPPDWLFSPGRRLIGRCGAIAPLCCRVPQKWVSRQMAPRLAKHRQLLSRGWGEGRGRRELRRMYTSIWGSLWDAHFVPSFSVTLSATWSTVLVSVFGSSVIDQFTSSALKIWYSWVYA